MKSQWLLVVLLGIGSAFGQASGPGSLIISAGPAGSVVGRKAEVLKPSEIAKLAEAQKKVDEAQKALDDVSAAIKAAHGQTVGFKGFTTSNFCSPYNQTSVEIWGDYALITTERIESSCIAY